MVSHSSLLHNCPKARRFEVLSGQIPLNDLLRGILSASLLHILAYPVLGFLVSQPLLAMARARETARVIVPGTDPGWTRVAVVPANRIIQVRAMGTVKFGVFSTTDTASAGVENNPFLQRLKMLLRGQAEEQIDSEVKDPTMEDFRRTSRQVHFSQGGVWIKIVTLRAHNELMPANLYYYWDKFYNDARLKFPVPVEVYAKVHDGGRAPEGCPSAYADNVGSYTVWLDVGFPIGSERGPHTKRKYSVNAISAIQGFKGASSRSAVLGQ